MKILSGTLKDAFHAEWNIVRKPFVDAYKAAKTAEERCKIAEVFNAKRREVYARYADKE